MKDALGVGHYDNAAFETAVKRCIPAEFLLIASQDEHTQAQEDYYAMDHFGFPCSPSVKKQNAGSVATCALLQMMYQDPHRFVAASHNNTNNNNNNNSKKEPWNVLQVLHEIKTRVKEATKLDAKPTISSSRPLGPPGNTKGKDKYAPFYIVPPGFTGTRRALLIGVVSGEGKDLKGPRNDIENIQQFLQGYCGFSETNITLLFDDNGPSATQPTRQNILNAFRTVVRLSQPKDVLFVQFSGHGGRVGNNLFLVPSDYKKNGEIMDQLILRDLIKAMPAQTYTTMLVDCCYSGTVGDLPYILKHNPLLGLPASPTRASAANVNEVIDKYFDTDTRAEVLAKESEGGVVYQNYRQARADRRIFDRLTLPARLLAEAAANASAAASAAATQVYQDVGNAATQVYQDVGQGITSTYEAGNAAAGAAYDAMNDAMSASLSAISFSSPEKRSSVGCTSTGGVRGPRSSTGSGAKPNSTTLDSFFSKASPRSRTGSPLRFSGGSQSVAEAEDIARKEAVERSRREAAAARGEAILESDESDDEMPNKRSSTGSNTTTPGALLAGAFSTVANSATATLNGVANSVNEVATSASNTMNEVAARSRSPLRRTATNDEPRSRSPFRRTTTTDDANNEGRSRSPFRRTATTDDANNEGRSRSPFRRTATTDASPRTATTDDANNEGRSRSPFRRTATTDASPNEGRSMSPFRRAAAKETVNDGRSMSPFRRTATATNATPDEGRCRSPFRRTATTDASANEGRSRSPFRRTETNDGARSKSPAVAKSANRPLRRTVTSPGPRSRSPAGRGTSPCRTTSLEETKIEDFEEAARKEAVERSKREAAEAREEARRRRGG